MKMEIKKNSRAFYKIDQIETGSAIKIMCIFKYDSI